MLKINLLANALFSLSSLEDLKAAQGLFPLHLGNELIQGRVLSGEGTSHCIVVPFRGVVGLTEAINGSFVNVPVGDRVMGIFSVLPPSSPPTNVKLFKVKEEFGDVQRILEDFKAFDHIIRGEERESSGHPTFQHELLFSFITVPLLPSQILNLSVY